mgnify:CR=1 FL=1
MKSVLGFHPHITVHPGYSNFALMLTVYDVEKRRDQIMMKKWFSTPKRTAVTICCLVALASAIGIGTALAAGSVRESTSIGKENAKNFAFADAGVDPVAAKQVHASFGHEQGHFVYEVEFVADNTEYEYWIKAEDGSVVKKQMEVLNISGADITAADGSTTEDAAEEKAQRVMADPMDEDVREAAGTPSGGAGQDFSGNTAGENSTGKEGASPYIGIDRAKTIALEHAGFREDEVRFSKAKLENDDGWTVYEVEFYKDGMEYEYKMEASTGEILEYDMDRDD